MLLYFLSFLLFVSHIEAQCNGTTLNLDGSVSGTFCCRITPLGGFQHSINSTYELCTWTVAFPQTSGLAFVLSPFFSVAGCCGNSLFPFNSNVRYLNACIQCNRSNNRNVFWDSWSLQLCCLSRIMVR